MCNKEEKNILDRVVDIKTPRNVHLSGFYKRSFAYKTIKIRMPVILTQIIDNLVRSKDEIKNECGEKALEELKLIIGEISKFKYEMQTNKEIIPLVDTGASDIIFYNNYLKNQVSEEGPITYFSCIWLLCECYMYRRVWQIFELTETLKGYDLFRNQKQQSFYQLLPVIHKLCEHLIAILKVENVFPEEENEEMVRKLPNEKEFINLIKINLWGNRCDMSLSAGVVDSLDEDALNVQLLNKNILCNHSDKMWYTLNESSEGPVDIICDNAGLELFTDFCVADYLISTELCKKIRFYVKTIPWFVSDVTSSDFYWMLETMIVNEDQNMKELGIKWSKYVQNGTWEVVMDDFWTLPVDFTYMKKVSPKLYKRLMEAKLLIFKGDLNYRKLFGEKNWDPTHPVAEALQGFHPAKLCSLRTIKSHIICEIAKEKYDELESKDPIWMETGVYAVIQYCGIILPF